MLNIIVCVKQVLDPEAPASAYEINSEAKTVKVKGAQPVQSPFDENALEAALRIKDVHESKITVISLGRTLAKPVLRKSLAAGADELVLIEDSIFEDMDSYVTALVLASFVKKMGAYDIVLTGMQAADTNAGVVVSGIAEILDIPCIIAAKKVELRESWVRAEQVVSDGYKVIESPLPALITVSNELGELRSVGIKELLGAQKKPIKIFSAIDLGFETHLGRRTELLRLFKLGRKMNCEIIGGDTPEQAAVNLALKLKEAEIL